MSQAQTSLLEEIFVDNFAGGGGASVGIELAVGKPVAIAINHDPDAIAMHKANHPYTKHYCESVWDIDPKTECAGRRVALAWFSPDCKHFSKAKGGTPVEKKIRGLAWIVLRWAGTVRPRVIILENVEEFQTWGPVRRGRPVKSHKGETFIKWRTQLESLGYKVEHRELKACDYGVPTIRKRFYLVARCDGNPIVFPEPTHGNPKSEAVKSGKLLPWRTAAECIDFTLPCKSIFGRKKPLAVNTMRRIARGVDKFVINNPQPFIVQVNHSGGLRGQSVDEPLQTITAKHGYGVTAPIITKFQQNSIGQSLGMPLDTVMSGATRFGLIAPSLIQYHSEQSGKHMRGQLLTEPIMTIDSSPRYALSVPFISKYYGGVVGAEITEPTPTVTAIDHNALTAAHLVEYYGNAQDGLSLQTPLHTITTKDREGIVTSHLCVLRNNMDGKGLDEPLPTITTSAGHFAEVRTVITKITDSESLCHWTEVRKLLNEHCGCRLADDEVLLFEFDGCQWYISDIGLRMLEPKELYPAQGFPTDYIIDFVYNGKSYSKSAQVARCGNSVSPQMAKVLVQCNLPEYCCVDLTTVAELNERIAV